MSVSFQTQPLGGLGGLGGLDSLGQAGGLQGLSQGPGGAAEIQAKLTEVILQILNLLINEIMKTLQQQQQGAQGGGGGGGGSPSAAGGPSSASGAGAPQGVGGPQGAPGAGDPQGPSNAYQPNNAYQAQQPTYAPPVSNAAAPSNVGDVSSTSGGGKAPAGMPAELWKDCQEAGKKTGVDPYILAAQMSQESEFGEGLKNGKSKSVADGLMQVEPGTRQAYAGKFQEKMGHAYDHNDPKDQVAMAGVILADKGGDATNMLQKYNGGDNWTPGATDSYGREIKATEYASSVLAKAQQMKAAG
ncbi:transglycosylase SLT domain-containing protein [Mitsuaria sp. 7]|uniref:transglycosylase SLT domain-containing protein n=1 Tax=Mitsuaria sp. 7 TaxID=1658665 RepID=UPI0008334AA0|nr:transglycosylase SLT domain-containing protein [Mitsuaria sp. 7]